jgi:release factor glutamine methyltransferase
MLIKDALHWGNEQLVLSSDSARLDAEVLLAYVLEKPATFLLAHDDSEVGFWQIRKYRRMIGERKKGVPVAYLTGHREFFGLDFEVNEHVLVPRPDTEILVSCVMDYIRGLPVGKKELVLVDVGTGSACIPVSILHNLPGIRAVTTEICAQAMKVARRNIKKHGMEGRITLIQSDLLEAVPADTFRGKEVVLTANLPYIPPQFQVHPSTKFEPDVALYGGEDGLDIYKRLFYQLSKIKPRAIFLECFEFQKGILAEHISDYELKYAKNMTGDARCLFFERED